MKRSWNPMLWAGFFLVLVALISYPLFFIRFPVTRDFPWVNLLLIAVAVSLLAAGLSRAFRRPEAYRGKISGSILAVLTLLLVGFFLVGLFYITRQIPASHGAPQTGQVAPDFTLPDSMRNAVTLSNLLNSPFVANDPSVAGGGSDHTAAAALIFYRGYW